MGRSIQIPSELWQEINKHCPGISRATRSQKNKAISKGAKSVCIEARTVAPFFQAGRSPENCGLAPDDVAQLQQVLADLKSSSDNEYGLDRLPRVPSHFVCQENGPLEQLQESWDHKVNVLLLWDPFGGVGKSTLARHFVARKRKNCRVFVWSFSQSEIAGAASDGPFIRRALRWFQVEASADADACDPWERGCILAERIQKARGGRRTILVLDGLESLQDACSGRLRDDLATSVRALLWRLAEAEEHNVMCIVTSRLTIPGLDEFHFGGKVRRIDVGSLSPRDGASLLRGLGVKGEDNDLERISAKCDGHPLSLTLLGTLLQPDETASTADRLAELLERAPLDEGNLYVDHFTQIMQRHEKALHRSPELQFLRLASLLTPTDRMVVTAIFARPPAIQGVSDLLVDLPSSRFESLIHRLSKLRLLNRRPASGSRSERLDMHPLVRGYCAERIRQTGRWKELHGRIFEHFRDPANRTALAAVGSDDADCSGHDELGVLYRAVFHGCEAGRYEEAFDLHWKSISQEERFSAFVEKGSYNLGALNGFYEITEKPFTRLVREIEAGEAHRWRKAMILGLTAFCLRPCKPGDARPLMKLSRDGFRDVPDFFYAAWTSGALAEIDWIMGSLESAQAEAEEGIRLAEKINDEAKRRERTAHNQTILGIIILLLGKVEDAGGVFRLAEEEFGGPLQEIPGARYCDFLYERGGPGDNDAVIQRARTSLTLEETSRNLLAEARYRLCLGRALAVKWQQDSEKLETDLKEARDNLDLAVEGFKRAGLREDVPWAFVARARFIRETGQWQRIELAQADLNEAKEICDSLKLKTDRIDCLLESARLDLALFARDGLEERHDDARQALKDAEILANTTGYALRLPEIHRLSKEIRSCPMPAPGKHANS